MKGNLRSKLTIAMWVLSAFSTLSATVLTGILWIRAQKISIDEQLQATATSFISLGISDFAELADFDKFDEFIEDTLQMEKVNKIIRVYDRSRSLVFSSVASGYDEIPTSLAGNLSKATFFTLQGKQDRYQSLVMPYVVKGQRGPFYLQIIIPLPRFSQILKNLWWESLLLLSLLIVFSLLLSKYLARRLLQPVQDIAQHLERIDPNRIQEWKAIPIDPQGEYLAAISSGINSLMERTRAAVLQIKKMGRYVAHEMRTPLTILQGEAENALSKPQAEAEEYRRVLSSSLEEVQRLSEIVSTVLQVGKIDDSAAYRRETFELKEWLETQRPSWESLLRGPVKISGDGLEVSSVQGDAKLLHRLVDNLIRNIRDHCPPATPGELRLIRSEEGLVLSVLDQGPGMPTANLDSLNQEGPHSAAAGVGLTLCFAIAQQWSIGLSFSKNEPKGLEAKLHFPVT